MMLLILSIFSRISKMLLTGLHALHRLLDLIKISVKLKHTVKSSCEL